MTGEAAAAEVPDTVFQAVLGAVLGSCAESDVKLPGHTAEYVSGVVGVALAAAGLLRDGEATVEWGVVQPPDADPVACSERYAATTARENGWLTFTRRPAGPWTPAPATDGGDDRG